MCARGGVSPPIRRCWMGWMISRDCLICTRRGFSACLRDRFGGGFGGGGLRKECLRKEIYTHAGPVLIAVNPFPVAS